MTYRWPIALPRNPALDRRTLWRQVQADFEAAKERCPENRRPVVLVLIDGIDSPLELGSVWPRREEDG